MTGHEIRHRFLDYFVARGHTRVPSAPLVPVDDPTLLFVNAGMVPFKDVFTGQRHLPYRRATSSQKCLRVSGKHNDFENVGITPRHHTFFEMLGNFSFGDYFKKEAIAYAWEFLTEDLELPPKRLWASVHESDEEAAALWPQVTGIPSGRVIRRGDADNFWAMGDTGPCGPCSEVFWDFGKGYGAGSPADNEQRYLEIWNLVFMQFERRQDGSMVELPRPSVDTGMGLERIAAVAGGVFSNYEGDLFTPLLAAIAERTGRRYEPDGDAGVSFRVLADHGRAATFLIGDGVYPSNEGRGYVLRRIIRRAVRHAWLLDIREPVLCHLVPTVAGQMTEPYPEIAEAEDQIEVILQAEEERFLQTIDQGMAILEKSLAALAAGAPVPGEVVFLLHDTHGFPPDLTDLIARERGHSIDQAGYESLMDRQRARARAASGFGESRRGITDWMESEVPDPPDSVAADTVPPATTFVGYDQLVVDTVIERVRRIDGGFRLVLRRNPFYATGGGQVADTGTIEGDGFRLRVVDVERRGETFLPVAELAAGDPDRIVEGAAAHAAVDAGRRRDTERHHTVTHVLHAILRARLGDHVRQAGSLVAPERMRFDFSHPRPLGPEEIRGIEDQANAWVLEDLPVRKEILPFHEARERGAMALFGEKYGDEVRVVTIGESRSVELCGGCHVRRTGEIGPVKILSESSAAGGVRRIEVVTGTRALEEFRRREAMLAAAAERLKVAPEDVPARIERLLEEKREAERGLESVRRHSLKEGVPGRAERSTTVDGFQVLTLRAEPVSMDDLRAIGDAVRSRLASGVGVIGAELGGKANLLTVVTDDLIRAGKIDARRVIGELAVLIGGGGGGKKHMAQAGGKDVDRLEEALDRAPEIVARLVGG
ncbi:MAG TPA: alanine--tRNA ligase [Gemmatimonadota bacterium]|nr:alanine--tRNA ligase [Gemmatimonadota bacterium]